MNPNPNVNQPPQQGNNIGPSNTNQTQPRGNTMASTSVGTWKGGSVTGNAGLK
jgi:hypothetical protein